MISHSLTIRAVTFILLLTLLSGVLTSQRAITNPSTELPAIANGIVVQSPEGTMPGWLTSHPVQGCGAGCRPIERWSTGFNGVTPATGAGLRWVELNAFTNSMIYQSVCMTNGESFGYSFLHRGRIDPTAADEAQFRLGIPTGLPVGSKPANLYDFPIATVRTNNSGGGAAPTAAANATVAFAAAGNGWRRYSGTFAYTGTTQVVNIGFVALSSVGGLGVGNFIDDWQITLSPYVEFSPASDSGNEGSAGGSNTPANRPAIRIGGTLTAPVTITFQVAGGSATIGTDYSLSVPFASGNTTSTASITIPVGTYDGASAASLFPVPFSIAADTGTELNETVDFAITSAPGVTIASIGACGTPPITNSTYTILNDDIVTAAGVTVSGRVLTADGRGLARNYVILTDSQGNSRTAMTSTFGYFRFDEVQAGETYVLSVSTKRYQFAPQIVSVNDSITGLDFRALE